MVHNVEARIPSSNIVKHVHEGRPLFAVVLLQFGRKSLLYTDLRVIRNKRGTFLYLGIDLKITIVKKLVN